MVEFLNSLVELGKTNPLALLLVLAVILSVVLMGGVGLGMRWLDHKNKRLEVKQEEIKRRDDAKLEGERRKAEREEQSLTTLTTMTKALIDQTQQIGRLVDNLDRGNQIDADKTKALEAQKVELTEQGDTLDTLLSQTVAQANALERHRVEVKPSLEEIASQGERLLETNRLLTVLGDVVKGLPAQVKEQINPDLTRLLSTLDSVGTEMKKLVKDFEEMRGTIIDVVTKTITTPAPDPLPTPIGTVILPAEVTPQ